MFALLITGRFIISPFAMILVLFMTDFVKITLATDHVSWSRRPETWDVTGLVKVAVILGMLMVVEAFGLLYIGWNYFGLGTNEPGLHTFAFEILLYFALFSVFAVRERRHFWSSMPGKSLLMATALDAAIAMVIVTVGIPGLAPLPFAQTLFVVAYAFVFSLVVNDLIKFALVKKARVGWQ